MSDKHVFKVNFVLRGGHVHCALFVAPRPDATYARCGDFVVSRGTEFRDLMQALKADYRAADDETTYERAITP